MRHRYVSVLVVVVLVHSLCVHARPPSGPAVAELVRAARAKHDLPAVWAAVVGPDGVIAIECDGLHKIGSLPRATVDDRVHLGSDTKAMTATLIARLVEAGKLRLDTTMADALVDLAPRMNARLACVTVEQLLGHRGGVPANVDWHAYARGDDPITAQRRRIVEDVLSAEPAVAPGEFLYSNVGYAILGAIIEQDAGKSWETVIADELFKPLSMTTAGFGPPGKKTTAEEPWGHGREGGKWQPWFGDNAEPLGPAGRVHCSIRDWAQYIAWTLRVHRADTPLLKQATQQHLLTPLLNATYAGGWGLTERPWAGGRALTHAGSNTRWYCVAWVAPEKQFAVLVVTNAAGDGVPAACDELVGQLIGWREKAMRKPE